MIAKLLLDRIDESLKSEGKGGADSFKSLRVPDARQSRLEHQRDEIVPLLLVVENAFWVIGSLHEHFLQLSFIVNVDVPDIVSLLTLVTDLAHDVRRLTDFNHFKYN